MTEPASRFESLVDQQIRQAQERGEFDDLPGMGQPLPGKGRPDDDQWWIRGYLAREGLPTDPLLPPSLRLAKEIENLPEQVRHLTTEAEVRAAVRELNERIAAHLRAPSGPPVPVRPVNPDRVVTRWHDARHAAGD